MDSEAMMINLSKVRLSGTSALTLPTYFSKIGVEDLKPSLWRRFLYTAEQLDLLGLVLLGASIAFILLPLTLANKSADGWANRTPFNSRKRSSY